MMESRLRMFRGLPKVAKQNALFCLAWECSRAGFAPGLRMLALERAPLGNSGRGNVNLLHLSAYSGDLESVQILLDWGLSPSSRSDFGFGPLHWACFSRRGSALVARALANAGADPLARDDFGMAPAHWAQDGRMMAWFAARLWAAGIRRENLAAPDGLRLDEVCETLGHFAAAKWLRESSGATAGQADPKQSNSLQTAAKAKDALLRDIKGCGCQDVAFPV